jgi:hypothetical protein
MFVEKKQIGDFMRLIKVTYGVVGLLAIVLAGCARTGPNKESSRASYQEDLSKVRPHYTYVEPKIENKILPQEKTPAPKNVAVQSGRSLDVTRKLEVLLDTIAEQNKAIKYINGFRIQIYVGNVRSEADAAKAYIYTAFSELTPYVTYSQPTYRVKAGDFMYRSDAEHFLEQIRQQYSTAMILADRVEIKNSLQVRISSLEK